MAEETITVPEVHCGHCKTSIEGALAPLEGVRSATVDIDGRKVEIDYDDHVVNRERLVAAIEEQGYEVP